MTGTIVNAAAVFCGCILGMFIKGGIKEDYRKIVMEALGLCTIFLGASSALGGLLSGEAESVLFIVSLVLGSIAGSIIDIDGKLINIGELIQKSLKGKGGNVTEGFVTSSLVFCVGSMSILGSIESGISGNHTTLYAKSILDSVGAIIFTSGLGVGVFFSVISILVYQGSITLLAHYIEPYLTGDIIREMTIVGGILIFALGLNLMEVKKIKVANMLPALIVPVLYYTVQGLL